MTAASSRPSRSDRHAPSSSAQSDVAAPQHCKSGGGAMQQVFRERRASRVRHGHRLRAVLGAIGMATMLACARAAEVLVPISECGRTIRGAACTCPADASKIMRCNPHSCLRGPMLALHPHALSSTHDSPACFSEELLHCTAVEQRPGRRVLRHGMLCVPRQILPIGRYDDKRCWKD